MKLAIFVLAIASLASALPSTEIIVEEHNDEVGQDAPGMI